jgi:hypothetical protein
MQLFKEEIADIRKIYMTIRAKKEIKVKVSRSHRRGTEHWNMDAYTRLKRMTSATHVNKHLLGTST